ncbi:MAG: cupin [Capnocytophaga sp.]|nr:cupin [Capnocytophaga sp.]
MTASFTENLIFSGEKVTAQLILESDFSKEIRITMQKGQIMKKHQTPFPIVVHLLEGHIEFGVEEQLLSLKKGDILALKPSIPHDLKALENSIVRLTLSKADQVARVEKVTDL